MEGEVIVSYSQNAEDVRLWRVFRNVEHGFYVDVGAGDPVEESVTKLFYDRGWSGINIEPGPSFSKLALDRPRDVNLRLAVTPTEEKREFWVSVPHSGLSTLHRPGPTTSLPEGFRFERETVECKPLWRILEEHANGRSIDFLKIDVEGAEEDVLRSVDLRATRVAVLVVEAVAPLTLEPNHAAWEHILTDVGYEFAAFDGINRFYVDHAHRDIIPALAYPICDLDGYVTAAAHNDKVEMARRVHKLEAERSALTAQLASIRQELQERATGEETLDRSLDHVSGELVEVGRENSRLTDEIERLRSELDAVYRSRTWRAGRIVAAAGTPAITAARRIPRLRVRAVRKITMRPEEEYAAAAAEGQAWHFAHRGTPADTRREATPLDGLITRFGEPHVAVDAVRASELAEELDLIGWTAEESLLAKRLSWAERQAVVEADSVVRLVAVSPDSATSVGRTGCISSARPVTVVDARCLQDPRYRQRGVGLHSRAVLDATKRAAPENTLVLVTSAELPALDPDVTEMADDVIVTPFAVRDADIVLFVQLSPMTASIAPSVPFLASRTCKAVSVVYDFIPSEFPTAYLTSAVAILTNRARIEALRHYDLLLPISNTTATVARRIVGDKVRAHVTGVGDPLHNVSPDAPPAVGPFMLVPAGGDPRKNTAAAVATVARHLQASEAPLRAVVTGGFTDPQVGALHELARRVGLPADGLELRGSVSDSELAGLYRAAELVFVPSFAEGFSIPLAEAVLRGTPVVASDISAHRELIGAGPWLADPADVESLAESVSRVRRERDSVLKRQCDALGDTADPAAVLDRVTTALEDLLPERSEERAVPGPRRVRPRLAVVSPFPPQRSGVADYTAFTFGQVAKYADVEVYSAASPEPSSPLPVHSLSAEPYLDPRFDSVISVIGNSHFHFPILDLLGSYGGAAIGHDNRMVEAYRYDRDDAWTANLLSGGGRAVRPDQLDDLLLDMDRLPSIGYDIIAREASPLIVHGRALAARIFAETGVDPVVVPFVPYNVPQTRTIDAEIQARARYVLGLLDNVLHVATLGIVDRRTKGFDLIVGAAAWLRSWSIPVHLHIVGDAPSEERQTVEALAQELGVGSHVTLHGRVPRETLDQFLLGVDVAVQLRTSAVLSLSGALADCIAFGVPTVTTEGLANELDAPSYVVTTASATSSLLVAEALESLRQRRREDVAAIDAERQDYLNTRSVDAYARALLDALGLEPT